MADAEGPSWMFIAPPPVAFRRDPPRPPRPARIPDRTLRLGEYLFYAGLVSWKDCCEALQWQRAQRPLIGELAVRLRYLTRDQVAEIFRLRAAAPMPRKNFGEFAADAGFLTPVQVVALVGQQRRLQRPIGQFFVERGLVAQARLDEAQLAMRVHNARVRLAAGR